MFLLTVDDVKNYLIDNATKLISTAVVIVVCLLLVLIAKIITKKFISKNQGKRKHAITMAKLILSVIKYVVYILMVVILLGVWGIDVTPLLAGAGIVALGISLGAQKIIGDLVSGLFIVFENSFDVDDVVEINGFKGTVQEISLRNNNNEMLKEEW